MAYKNIFDVCARHNGSNKKRSEKRIGCGQMSGGGKMGRDRKALKIGMRGYEK